ncbi:TlpA disulfide reductase family protein [Pseudonocardia sp. KRD291]|uniref:TlpA family protein disulfide reductase n=1 Tax=Pseudonocardia sp. KRD291 TaxID=2792007 RepID=UPI001C4A2C49|nr:TlpA disulfide reductase family protein [Pseudonocardia sp. KRD291]MBW0103731.1 TlpA family protein disulfide reductase [Pseudonocardia sp. KRD291]
MSPAARILAALTCATALLLVSGCSFSNSGTAPSSAKQFTFVAPGGQDRIFYDPPQDRGEVRGLSGQDMVKDDRTLSLANFRGQVVVLNVWGTWCGPCRAEMPDLQQLHQRLGPQGVTVLGIDVRDDRDAARDFLASRSITYPNIFDQPGRSLLALEGFPRNTVPSTVVLDRQHRVAAVYLRSIRLSELLPVVQRVAAEPSSPAPTPGPAPGAEGSR